MNSNPRGRLRRLPHLPAWQRPNSPWSTLCANGNAQKTYFGPYEKATGNKVVAVEYNGEQAKIKAMVEAKKVNWDVVEVESPT